MQYRAKSRNRDGFILAIDLGTSSIKSAIFDGRGRRILETTVQQAYPLLADATGRAELSPRTLADAFDACVLGSIGTLRTLRAGEPFQVAAVGISCFWHSLLGLDGVGTPLTEVLTWADSRCRDDAAKLRETWGEQKAHSATGCMLRPSFWPAKLHWLRRTQKALWKRVRRWVSPAEWLVERWCGEGRCAIGMATGTGIFRPADLKWDAKLLHFLGVTPSQLNPVGDEPLQPLSERIARLPELRGSKWFPAIGDGAASNLGCGAVSMGLAALNIGTSAALRVMRTGTGRNVRAPLGLFCYRVDAERYLLGGAISNAGNVRAWCLRELRLAADSEEVEKMLGQRPIPHHGLTVLPFWLAERAPYWRENMRSVLMGMTPATTAMDILQATSEAVYYRIATIAAKVIKTTGDTPQIIVSGGAQKSPSSMRRLANILNQPLYPSDEPEASLRGAGVFALEKMGWPVERMRLGRPVRPEPRYVEAYRAALEEHAGFEESLAGLAL